MLARALVLTLALSILSLSLYAEPKKKERVRVMLKWFYQYQFAGYIMAKEKGFYDEAGLEVELIERDPSKNHIEQVIDGRADYGVSDSSILLYRAKGNPVRIVSSFFQHNAMVLISKRDSGIVSPYEMKGKRISYQEGIDDAIFGTMFDYARLDEKDFIKVPMDFSYERFIKGDIDVIAAYITDQPYWIRKRGVELNIINPLSYGIDLYGDNLFTTDAEIDHHPERVRRMRDATIRGWRYALQNKEETIRVIIEKYQPSLSFDQLMYEARETERLIAPDRVSLGYSSKDRFHIIARVYENSNLSAAKLAKAVDTLIYDPDFKEDHLTTYLYTGLILTLLAVLVSLFLYFHNRRLNTLVKERTQALKESQQEALEAANSKALFLANMSHEIRTPMNSILGFVDQLSKKETDQERQKQFQIIRNSGNTLLVIINDILDFSKIESGKLTIEQTCESTRSLFKDAALMFHDTSEAKRITFNYLIDPDVPECLMLDGVRMNQIIFNLLSNAIKFTPEGGNVSFTVTYNIVHNTLECAVRDTGIGIAEENLDKIFNAFDQEDISTTRKFGGTGLGLSISSHLVKMMGGELKVSSCVGEGSRFYFEIPVKTCECSKVSVPVEESPAQPMESFKGKVLVVEDNKTNQMLMGIILDDLGIDYDVADDGEQGVKAFKMHQYAAILMDENMPVMNGIVATRLIREYETQNHKEKTPIIAVTANALIDDRQRFLDAGMDDYVSKPYTEEDISKVLNRFLK
jgi:signal transduction histidine kinase/ActR/RegA family two-component response regulator